MDYLSLFRMPTPMKITGRSSSITNSFINSIIPTIVPTNQQVKEALDILGMNHGNFQCAYCGATASEWDHLRPLVLNKKPTGYISEIHNLVPACGKCNQSKGNKPWASWIVSTAKLSPKSRGVGDLEKRIERLTAYEKWQPHTVVDFEAVVGKEKWERHWANWELVQNTMRQAQVLATEINKTIAESYAKL
ncbi:HNH endonuclease [Aurantivibrio plasticivorans]